MISPNNHLTFNPAEYFLTLLVGSFVCHPNSVLAGLPSLLMAANRTIVGVDSVIRAYSPVIINAETAERVGSPIPLDQITSRRLVAALRVWREQADDEKFPSRAAMTPRCMAPFLANVVLVALYNDDFEFRIVGDAAVVAFGQDFKNMRRATLNAREPGFGDVMARVFKSVAAKGEPLALSGRLVRPESDLDHHQAIFLPLGVDNVVDHILYVGDYSTPLG